MNCLQGPMQNVPWKTCPARLCPPPLHVDGGHANNRGEARQDTNGDDGPERDEILHSTPATSSNTCRDCDQRTEGGIRSKATALERVQDPPGGSSLLYL